MKALDGGEIIGDTTYKDMAIEYLDHVEKQLRDLSKSFGETGNDNMCFRLRMLANNTRDGKAYMLKELEENEQNPLP